MMQETVNKLFDEQLAEWPLASSNYRALNQVRTKLFENDKALYKVQF